MYKIKHELLRKFIGFIFLYSLALPLCSEQKYKLGLFDFKADYPSECDANENCYKVDDLVKRALEFGLESRMEIQMLFQARSEVRSRIANILPQINVIGVLSTVITSAATRSPAIGTDAVIPLVGFLFPSRWFEIQSSRRLRDAEAESLNTLFADRAQAIQHFYFDIQTQIWSIRILEFYIHELERVVSHLHHQRIGTKRRASHEDIAVLENIRAGLMYDVAFVDNLSASYPRLASAIGLDPARDWSFLRVEPHNIEEFGHVNLHQYNEFYPKALELSTEIKNVSKLLAAAKEIKRSLYFDYFDPASGHDLGFGNGYRLKIARSQIHVLNVLMLRTKMQLSTAIHSAINNYNDSITAYPGVEEGLNKLVILRHAVERHINDNKAPLDIMKFVRYFQYAKDQALRFAQSYFIFKGAETDLNRYTWNGHLYDIVREYQKYKLPEFLKDVKKENSFRHAVKEKIIKFGKILRH